MLATTRELANKHNLTYRQTRYLIDKGVINPAPAKEGQAWEVSDLDLWILEAAAVLRKNKISVLGIQHFASSLEHFMTDCDVSKEKDKNQKMLFRGYGFRDVVLMQWIAKPGGGEWTVNIGMDALNVLPHPELFIAGFDKGIAEAPGKL